MQYRRSDTLISKYLIVTDRSEHCVHERWIDKTGRGFKCHGLYAGGDPEASPEEQWRRDLRQSDVGERRSAASGGVVWDTATARGLLNRCLYHPDDASRHTADPGPIRPNMAGRAEDPRLSWTKRKIGIEWRIFRDGSFGGDQRLFLQTLVHSSLHRSHRFRRGIC